MLEVKNLTKSYGDKQAIRQISFTVQRGEIVGFLGVNGAGKSTTMNIITGYLSATSGEVLVDGADILTQPLAVKSRIGYLPEQPPVYMEMTVQEYLSFLYDLKKVKSKKLPQTKAQHLEQICAQVKIDQVTGRLIRNLSKGYRQRVGLAQALLGDPELLILDEPTVGLDPAQIIEIRSLIKSLAQRHTILLSSHILPEIQAVCGRIILLHQGRIVADDTPENLARSLSDDRLIQMEIEGDPQKVLACLERCPGVLSAAPAQNGAAQGAFPSTLYSLETDASPQVRRSISLALSQEPFPILSMSRSSVTLEDVFLRLTSDVPGHGDSLENPPTDPGEENSPPEESPQEESNLQ